jgi:hypothetical protein
MKKLEWELYDREGEWAKYEAETEIGTYVMFANEKEGVYEAYFRSVDGQVEDVYGMYDIYDARQAAQAHYNANVEANP